MRVQSRAVRVACLALCLTACSDKGNDGGTPHATGDQAVNPATGAGAGGGGGMMPPMAPAGGGGGMSGSVADGAGGTSGSAGAMSAAGSGGMTGSAGEDMQAGTSGDAAGTGGTGEEMPACDKDVTPPPGSDDCTAPLAPNSDRLCKFTYNGAMRQFYIYAPPSYNPCEPASLIMDCHGLSETAEVHTGKEGFNLSGQQFPKGYGSSWRLVVQHDNAVVITPQGVNNSWSTATDVPFVNAIADMVEGIADIDPEKEYVTGISMGGMMTVATGCGDAMRWRGMAPVAMLSQACSGLSKPTPTIHFHAMTDQLTSYADDRNLATRMAMLNHCQTGPTDWKKFGGASTADDPVCFEMPNGVGDPDAPDPYNIPLVPCSSSLPESACVRWDQCDDGVAVVFCTVAAGSQPIGGHILYNNDTQLAPAALAWPFFKSFW
jgi:poly(3-hydroxybutyrate) depolymerase